MRQIITPLTSPHKHCLIRLSVVRRCLAAKIFKTVTIAHDKGKPVVRRRRKAVSLSSGRGTVHAPARWERLSGCRRRSKKAKTSTYRHLQTVLFRGSKLFSSGNPFAGHLRALLHSLAVVARTAHQYSHLHPRWFAFFSRIPFFFVHRQEIPPFLTNGSRKPDGFLSSPLFAWEADLLVNRMLSPPYDLFRRASFTD